MSACRSTRKKERERRGGSLPSASSSSGGNGNKAAALSAWGARAQRQASESEREENKRMPELYTTRGRRKAKGRRDNWPAALPLMAGGQSGAIDQEGGANGRKLLELDCGELTAFTQATKNYAMPNNDAQSLVVSRLIKLSLII
jgi:hypothetical protein